MNEIDVKENNELEVKEEICEMMELNEIESKRGFGTVVCGVILAVGGTAYYFWKKNRDKAETKKIEKEIAHLESLGYTVKIQETEEEETNDDSNVEETTEE